MNQVRIGTIVPGDRVHDLLPEFIKSGFECFALNFHMEFPDESLAAFAERVKAAVDGEMPEISSIGYYCNPLENEEQLHILEKFIDGAHLFNTNMVTTFAGALYSRPVEEAIPVYKKVFGELAKRAEANGVRLSIENCTMGGTWRRATYNIGFNPRAWQMMFDAVDSPAIGLEWEPAHQMVQLIDPVPSWKNGSDVCITFTVKMPILIGIKSKNTVYPVHHSLQFPERRDMAIQIGVRFSMCSIGTIFRVIFALRVSMMTFSTAIWK